MKYRVMAILAADTEDELRDVWDKIKDAWDKMSHLEDDSANLHKCFHDESPGRPCEVIEELVAPSP